MTLGNFDFSKFHHVGISDEQYARELRAEKRLAAAIAEMKAAIGYVNQQSALVEIEPSSFENLIHDEFPSEEYWAEKLFMARTT
jgi:ABC-type phosphate/phosphonate transport system ATPase subunit